MTQARPLVHGIDVGVVEDAIRAVEQRTSGEIRVALARFWFWGDVRRSAEKTFMRLHVDRTRRRNGVLIFLAPWRRRLAVIGDVGAQENYPSVFSGRRWSKRSRPTFAVATGRRVWWRRSTWSATRSRRRSRANG